MYWKSRVNPVRPVGVGVKVDGKVTVEHNKLFTKGALAHEALDHSTGQGDANGNTNAVVPGQDFDNAASYSKLDAATELRFTYSTSSDPGQAGPAADMFLMPSATVTITQVKVVKLSKSGTVCSIHDATDTSWTAGLKPGAPFNTRGKHTPVHVVVTLPFARTLPGGPSCTTSLGSISSPRKMSRRAFYRCWMC